MIRSMDIRNVLLYVSALKFCPGLCVGGYRHDSSERPLESEFQ